MNPVREQGYLVVALNSDVDYVRCARQLALSIKTHNPAAQTCLITDQDVQASEFDFVKTLSYIDSNPYANDWQIFKLSPFRETIKIEADCLVASPIDHWWSLFRHRDVVISTGCRTWQNQPCTSRYYRKTFDANQLPDVYNALTYWRRSETAKEFFYLTRDIFTYWTDFKKLIRFGPNVPDTDLVYAIAAQIIGVDQVTLPGSPQIVHMKKYHAGTELEDWTRELTWEYHSGNLRINTIAQHGVFHYVIKDWQP